TRTRSLELPGRGAVAHMSLHQKPTMSKSRPTKEADTCSSPICTGGPVVRSELATDATGAGENRQRLIGERAYMDGLGFGQRLFATLLRRPEKPRKSVVC